MSDIDDGVLTPPKASPLCTDPVAPVHLHSQLIPAKRHHVRQIQRLQFDSIPNCAPETVVEVPRCYRRYRVICTANDRVVAAGATLPLGHGRWEIRGLITDPHWRGLGLASRLVEGLLAQHQPGAAIFAVTRHPAFFRRLGFGVLPPGFFSTLRHDAPERVAMIRGNVVAVEPPQELVA